MVILHAIMDKNTSGPQYSRMESNTVNITYRVGWGAADPRSKKQMSEPAKRVVIHHTAIRSGATPQDCIQQVTRIQKMHMKDRDFDDIGYNFLVGQNGMLYEGRGWGIVGAHTKGHNQDSVGIAVMGNFNNDLPTSAALSSVKRLLQDGVSRGWLHSNYTIFGHRDLANTECPGDKLYPEIQRLRSDRD
ncbi:peptidoglycan recognition protein 5 isoform X2 [Clupea harengus]|uniref:Peptidoglycan-recognition protein n=1 Tax=Clupea harengus TaxID=7950 RepID=A0A6P3VWE4_CLUHA|nr:peptidoglycan recognition protein 5 isoform X2 [Clupea harengus]